MKFWGHRLSVLAVITMLALQTMPAWAPFFAQDGQRLEICTTQGIVTITFDENGIATEQTGDEADEHCPLMTARDMVPSTPDLNLAFLQFDLQRTQRFIELDLNQYSLINLEPFSSRDPPLFS